MSDLKELAKKSLKRHKGDDWVWWKHGVIYHIYPRSFYDTNDDGIGDIQGIITKLSYLKGLGIDAIWLSPIYESLQVDFGYDVAHYRKIDASYGTIDDFKVLVEEAHALGIRIIMDMVLNHTSDQHDWFEASKSSLDDPKRDWYIWQKGKGKKPPNNWKSAFGGSAWTFDERTGEYYLHSFMPEQPDLNWRNSEVKDMLFGDIKYWLDLGVDGFRLDVINMIGKDKKFRNNPSWLDIFLRGKPYYSRNRKRSLKITRKLRQLLDSYDGNKVVIGEVFAPPPGNSNLAASYLGEGDDSLNLTFDFSLLFARWGAKSYYQSIASWYDKIPEHGWPCNVLSNHDLLRSYDRYKWRPHKLRRAKIEALLMMTLLGTPFIYYGEEIGQANHRINRKDLQDPLGKKYWPFFSGRDPARTPMQWTSERYAGFSVVKPWLPANENVDTVNVAYQLQDRYSMLNLYKRLIALRHRYVSLNRGEWHPVEKGNNGILAYERIHKQEHLLVVLNFTNSTKRFELPTNDSYELLFSINNPQEVDKVLQGSIELEAYAGVILK